MIPDTVLPSLLPHRDTDSGRSSCSPERGLTRSSWSPVSGLARSSCSPDTGLAGEMQGEMTRRELPTPAHSDLECHNLDLT